MEKTIISQLVEAMGALAVGAALGILYDFFRCVRREFNCAALRLGCDAVFALSAAAAMFAFGVASPSGGVTLYIVSLSFAGAILYFATLGKYMRRAFTPILRCLRKILAFCAKMCKKLEVLLKKIKEFLKNVFSSAKKRFTITGKAVDCENPDQGRKGRKRETEENRTAYEGSYRGPDYLRRDQYIGHSFADIRGGARTE